LYCDARRLVGLDNSNDEVNFTGTREVKEMNTTFVCMLSDPEPTKADLALTLSKVYNVTYIR